MAAASNCTSGSRCVRLLPGPIDSAAASAGGCRQGPPGLGSGRTRRRRTQRRLQLHKLLCRAGFARDDVPLRHADADPSNNIDKAVQVILDWPDTHQLACEPDGIITMNAATTSLDEAPAVPLLHSFSGPADLSPRGAVIGYLRTLQADLEAMPAAPNINFDNVGSILSDLETALEGVEPPSSSAARRPSPSPRSSSQTSTSSSGASPAPRRFLPQVRLPDYVAPPGSAAAERHLHAPGVTPSGFSVTARDLSSWYPPGTTR